MTPDPNTIDYLRDTVNDVWAKRYGGTRVDSFDVLAHRVKLMAEDMEERQKAYNRLLSLFFGKIES